MNSRERLLSMVLIPVLALIVSAYMLNRFLLRPLKERSTKIAELRQQIIDKEVRIQEVLENREKLERWNLLSLPGNPDVARRSYEKYLGEVVLAGGGKAESFEIDSASVRMKPGLVSQDKKPVYTPLTFTVKGVTSLAGLVQVLERFHKAPLLHKIKTVQVEHPPAEKTTKGSRDLVITLAIEALIVDGTDPRSPLPPANAKAREVLAAPPRDYAAIAAKDIFFGKSTAPLRIVTTTPTKKTLPADLSPLRNVVLNLINRTNETDEATLHDGTTERSIHLTTSPGKNQFPILGGSTPVNGEVVRIDDRDVIFRLEGKAWSKLIDNKSIQATESTESFQVDKTYWDKMLSEEKIRLIASTESGKLFFLAGILGEVIREDGAKVMIRVPSYFAIHVGKSLEEAIKKPLTEDEVEVLGLPLPEGATQ